MQDVTDVLSLRYPEMRGYLAGTVDSVIPQRFSKKVCQKNSWYLSRIRGRYVLWNVGLRWEFVQAGKKSLDQG